MLPPLQTLVFKGRRRGPYLHNLQPVLLRSARLLLRRRGPYLHKLQRPAELRSTRLLPHHLEMHQCRIG
jgi:hypothetical protein